MPRHSPRPTASRLRSAVAPARGRSVARDPAATRGPATRGAGPFVRVGAHLRVGPWQGGDRVAVVLPVNTGTPCPVAEVRRALAELSTQGYSSAVTAALSPLDQAGFLTAGFRVHERLHLLARELPARVAAPALDTIALRRANPADRQAVLAIDHRAFDPFWRLDRVGLSEAITATPSARFRVAVSATTSSVVAYTVVGRASNRGYIQRLAVAPDHHGRGVGRALLVDGLRWLERRRVRRVMVNTQEHNVAALALYERAGFERQAGGLAVLSRSLQDLP